MTDAVIAFHGSPNSAITAFAPLTHFGSRAAARARAARALVAVLAAIRSIGIPR